MSTTLTWLSIAGFVIALLGLVYGFLKLAREIHTDFQPDAERRVRQYKTAGRGLWLGFVIASQILNIVICFREAVPKTHAELVYTMLRVSFSVCAILFLLIVPSLHRLVVALAKSHLDHRAAIKDMAGVVLTLNDAVGMIAKEAKLKDETRKKLEDFLR